MFQPGFRFDLPDGGGFEWGWQDWMGLAAIILVVTFTWVVVRAIRSGVAPLRVLREIAKAVTAIIRRRPN